MPSISLFKGRYRIDSSECGKHVALMFLNIIYSCMYTHVGDDQCKSSKTEAEEDDRAPAHIIILFPIIIVLPPHARLP